MSIVQAMPMGPLTKAHEFSMMKPTPKATQFHSPVSSLAPLAPPMEEPTDPNLHLSFDDAVDSFEQQEEEEEEDPPHPPSPSKLAGYSFEQQHQHEEDREEDRQGTLDSPHPPSPSKLAGYSFEQQHHQQEEDRQGTPDSPQPPSPFELIKTPPNDDTSSNQPPLDAPQTPSLRRRRSVRFSTDSSYGERRRSRILPQLHDAAATPEASSPTVTLDRTIDSRDETLEIPNGGFLFWIAGFVVKSIFFQLNLLIASFLFPVKLLHFSFLMVTDPCGTVKRALNSIKERFLSVWHGVMEIIGPWVSVRGSSNQQGLGKLAVRVVVGCFWSVYVGFILFGVLVTAFLGGSLVMRCVVEEPLRVERELNFDYTKPNPDALVSIDSKGGIDCHNLVSGGLDGLGKELGLRVVPMNHRLQLVISLTLPESDYNRKLGIFQVRADFLSANGKVTYSSSQPCMLRFKSPHIRFVETFLKTGTLLAGYSSESQILSIKLTGFIEGNEPTVCVRLVLEPRAEFRPGAGIPEIYAASLKLESQLPLLKRIIWNWRRTVFIWVGMMFFFFELLIVLVCCRTVIIPRSRQQ